MKYLIQTFGCQFNESDSEKAAAIFENLGFEKTSDINEADLVMVLACSVRQAAFDRLYGLKAKFIKIKKNKPNFISILSGCVLKADKKKMADFFSFIIDSKELDKIPESLYHLNPKAFKDIANSKIDFKKLDPNYNSKFQANVQVMSGCNNFCAYCVVPYTRGREVSMKAKEIIKECKKLIAQNFKVITLIGQNVNSYHDRKFDFPKLLKAVDQLPGDFWLTFATSHPKDMSDDLIKVMGEGQHIIPYLHLPVQSGDDEILRRMNRKYTAKHYLNLIKKVRKAVPDISLSTDTIVGFPGESKKQFLNTAKLYAQARYDMAYLAQYSSRAGTVAAKMDDNVSHQEKKRRELYLNEILKKTALAFNKKMLGQTVEVLVQSYKNGYCFGRTKYLKNIKFSSSVDYTGQFVLVKVIDVYAWGLTGQLPKVIVIAGTTSAGKTAVAVKLAKKIKGEIISADSRQVYVGMDIGTGKDLPEYGKIPFHLIDVAWPKDQYTVAQWQKAARIKINEILNRGKVPIVCGGTGLYISALIHGFNFSETKSKISAKKRLELNKLSLGKLLLLLKKIDAKTYEVVDKNNRRRVQRALEIFYETGEPKSSQPKNLKPPYDFLILGLNFPKEILAARIKNRLMHRLEKENMVLEIKNLHQKGISWQRLEDFGLEYRYIARYLQKKITYKDLIEQLNQAIVDFAKRQVTWFKKETDIVWVEKYQVIENLVKKFLK